MEKSGKKRKHKYGEISFSAVLVSLFNKPKEWVADKKQFEDILYFEKDIEGIRRKNSLGTITSM